jgi:hypothetical protein
MEGKDEESDNNRINNNTCNCLKSIDPRIRHKHPFYYCIEHPEFQNVNLESIIHHLLYSKDHKIENEAEVTNQSN